MYSPYFPPRHVTIGAAASFVGTTPRAIRHYHQIGLLPEVDRGSDGRRRYGYDDMIRLLWVRRMADAGIALDDIRGAFAESATGGSGVGESAHEVAGILERLEESLVAQEAELRRQREAVQRMRTRGSRMGLLSDAVARRLETLPEGSLRQHDLDSLLVIERTFGPLGAAMNATRYIALAADPDLRTESDRVDAAEEALDDTVAIDDPRVARVAAERIAFERALNDVMEKSGLNDADDEFFASWDAQHPHGDLDDHRRPARERTSLSAVEAVAKMPYDFSPARLHCMHLVALAYEETPASTTDPVL